MVSRKKPGPKSCIPTIVTIHLCSRLQKHLLNFWLPIILLHMIIASTLVSAMLVHTKRRCIANTAKNPARIAMATLRKHLHIPPSSHGSKPISKTSQWSKSWDTYQSDFISDENTIKDVFDGKNYKQLKEEYITIGGVHQAHKFFSDNCDIALGLSLNGFCPFKWWNQTCWPLIIFIYNLPPDIQFHLCNILCAGSIPGQFKLKDADSFAYPMVIKLLEFLAGVPTFDVEQDELFLLHAYLIATFGDIPVISMILHMKGHNGIFPCCICLIKGICVPNTWNTTHYVPLYHANHPVVLTGDNAEVAVYASANLPLCTHEQFLDQACHVQFVPTSTEEQCCVKACGIKGIPLFSHLPSLFFPLSFLFDFMHLIWKTCFQILYFSGPGNSRAWMKVMNHMNLAMMCGRPSEKWQRLQDPPFPLHMPQLNLKMLPKMAQHVLQIPGLSGRFI